jgi:poly(U)-specific endoribonuclease
MSIYQEIWNADQSGNGVRPILASQPGDTEAGYVKVAVQRTSGEPDTKVLPEVVIPTNKMATYDRVRALFDNYALDEQASEFETPEERAEVHDLLEAVIDTGPMQVARAYVSAETGTPVSRDRWYATLMELWFRRFNQGGDRDLSGFEHVFVGEQEGPKVQGYHFWYKYHLDDGLAGTIDRNRLPGFKDDRILYLRGQYGDGQERFPESVTISYKWNAADYDARKLRPLTKPKGGFFVGCSVEGLMALGAVRAHRGARAPKEAVINGARYDMKLFLDQANERHIRTFYPMYLGPAGEPPVVDPGTGPEEENPPIVAGAVKILAALVNPGGDDTGKEKITLVNAGPSTVDLDGWLLIDKMKQRFAIDGVELPPGVATTMVLPRHSIQLSNQGGEIRLVDRTGRTVHLVTYSKAQTRREGETIVF